MRVFGCTLRFHMTARVLHRIRLQVLIRHSLPPLPKGSRGEGIAAVLVAEFGLTSAFNLMRDERRCCVAVSMPEVFPCGEVERHVRCP